jgi:hypothetical protein
MLSRILCLISCMMFAAFSIGRNNGEEVLIIDDSAVTHKILMVQISGNGPIQKKLADDVSRFTITPNGHFLLQDLNEEWIKGKVDSSLNVIERAVISAPKNNITHCDISHDGTRIAWSYVRLPDSELIIQQYNKEKAND